jgi:catechol 2,3-dioxygenase-like lactoylglutathione lyase family enzyme
MAVTGLFYILIQVRDIAQTKRFYGETLGWALGTDEPGVGGFSFGTAYLVAVQDTRPEGERAYGGGMYASVQVSGIEDEHARLGANGVDVGSIETMHWGEKRFTFTDPDGYLWQYGEAAR